MKKVRWVLGASLVVLVALCVYFFVQRTPQVLAPTTDQTWSLLPVGWQTYVNAASGFSFSYPSRFSGNVWRPTTNWPISVVIVPLQSQNAVSAGCPDMTNASEQLSTLRGKTNEGLPYDLYQKSDVGAGQLYLLYCYIVHGENNYYVFGFTIHSTNGCGGGNCWPYCGTPNEQACKDLDKVKDIEGPLNQIVASFTLLK